MTGQPAAGRVVLVAAMRDRHGEQLHRLVERHAASDAALVDEACARAWAELVDECDVDVGPPLTLARLRTTLQGRRGEWGIPSDIVGSERGGSP